MTAGASVGTLRAVRIAGPGAEFLMDEEPVDVFIENGLIADIAPTGVLPARGGVVDAAGGWAIPGLWDSHVHVRSWALASERVSLADAGSAEEAARSVAASAPHADGRRIGIGFRDALWPDAPSVAVLDRATGEVPTYLVNADLHSVWLNSAALRREARTSPDGVLREKDAFEITKRLDAVVDAHGDPAVARAGARAAARGVTGLVDFDMSWNVSSWSRRAKAGNVAHRVELAIYPEDLERAIADGLRSGDAVEGTGLVRIGPLKVITDGSLGTRTAACSHAYAGEDARGALHVAPERLVELMTRTTGAGLMVAAHAIGDVAVASALDAFALSGATGTIEHAQLIRHADVARMARLGIAASIQPGHAVDDRDLADMLWNTQTSLAYPMRTLQDAGIALLLGSDAPVAPLDPWQAIAAAVARTADEREAWHPEEALTVEAALRASVRSELRPGAVADIAVLGTDPLSAPAQTLRTMPVQATILGGRLTHGA